MKTYCSKSWTDINIDLGKRVLRHCCRAAPYDFPDTLTSDYFANSAKIQQRRADSLQGIAHADCASCWDSYSKTGTAYRTWMNKWTDEFMQTAQPGPDELYVQHVEFELDTTCDMGCLYCSPWNSSKIAQEENVHVNSKISQADYDACKQWLAELISTTSLHGTKLSFNFVGGEPTASKTFYDLIGFIEAEAVKPGAKIVDISICTNCNSKPFLMDKLLSHIDNSVITWHIAISNESFGDDAELIRHGLDWHRFEQNLIRYICHSKIASLCFAPTVNALSITTFLQYVEWVHTLLIQHNHTKLITWIGNYVSDPVEMDVANLPDTYKSNIDSVIDFMNSNKADTNLIDLDNFLVFLYEMKARIGTVKDADYKEKLQKFIERKQIAKNTTSLSKLLNNIT